MITTVQMARAIYDRANNVEYYELEGKIENLIRAEASRANIYVDFEFYEYSSKSVKRMLDELKLKGFELEQLNEYAQCYRIKWE